jgi:lysophospholipase L1-like esterase
MTDSVYPNLIVCGDSTAVGTGKEGSPCLAASLGGYFPNLQRIGNQGLAAEEIYQEVQGFVSSEGPCIVVVTFGTNDVATGVGLETTIAHTRLILNHFTSQGHHVIGVPPYPFHLLPLVEAFFNNWQGEYESTQSMQTFFNNLPEPYKFFKNKSPHEITTHADALIAGIGNVFKEFQQPFLLKMIEDAYGMSFRNRMRMFQGDGIHLTEQSYNIAAGKIFGYIQQQPLILLPSATDQSRSS